MLPIVCFNVGDYDEMMRLEAHCDLWERWREQMPVPPERQLVAHTWYVVEHGGNRYDLGGDDETRPSAEYLKDELIVIPDYGSAKVLAYHMRLSGVHAGPPIIVLMVNPRDEPDEDGRCLTWDGLAWADDYTKFDSDWLLDWYTDALRDELRECARNWTS